MENTRENELRFKAQYFMVNVFRLPMVSKDRKSIDLPLTIQFLQSLADSGAPIYVTPISEVTTEDIIGLGIEGAISTHEDGYFDANELYDWAPEHIDYLRWKGYAAPWLGVSIKQQIAWGWVKLKEDDNA